MSYSQTFPKIQRQETKVLEEQVLLRTYKLRWNHVSAIKDPFGQVSTTNTETQFYKKRVVAASSHGGIQHEAKCPVQIQLAPEQNWFVRIT